VGLAGGGAEATNVILTKTNAHIDDSSLLSAGDVLVTATNSSLIDAEVLGVSGSLGVGGSAGVAASIGVALARNIIGSDIDESAAATYTTAETSDVSLVKDDTVRIADGAGAGDVYRYIGAEPLAPAKLATLSYNNTDLFERDNLVSGPDEVAEVKAYLSNSSVDAAGDLVQTATSDATIEAGVAAASVAVAGGGAAGVGATGAGVSTENIITTDVRAYIEGSGTTGVVADAITLRAEDSSTIRVSADAASIGGAVGGTAGVAVSIGVSLAKNTIHNDVQAYVLNADLVDTREGNVEILALESATVESSAVAAAVTGAIGGTAGVALSGAGAEATNVVNNDVRSYVSNSTVRTGGAEFTPASGRQEVLPGDRVRLDDGSVYEFVGQNADYTPRSRPLILRAGDTVRLDDGRVVEFVPDQEIPPEVPAPTPEDPNATVPGSIDLSLEDFEDTSRWVLFADLTTSDAPFILQTGDLVRTADGRVFEFLGDDESGPPAAGGDEPTPIDLSLEEYANPDRWLETDFVRPDLASESYVDNAARWVRVGADHEIDSSPIELRTDDRVRLPDGSVYAYLGDPEVAAPRDDGAPQRLNLAVEDYEGDARWMLVDPGPRFDVVLDAESHASLSSLVGAAAAAVSGGTVAVSGAVGVSIARNLVGVDSPGGEGLQNQTLAYIEDSTVSADGDVQVLATSSDELQADSFAGSVAVAVGIGGAVAGSGAVATNEAASRVDASIADSEVAAGGDVRVDAMADTLVLPSSAIGASLSASLGAASVALSEVDNVVRNQVHASIESSTAHTMRAGNDVTVTAHAEAAIQDASAVTTSISGGLVALSGGGIEIDNVVANDVDASISGSTDVDAGGEVTVRADEDAVVSADATAVSVAVGLGGAVGAAVIENQISSTIEARIESAVIDAAGIGILADSVADIQRTTTAGVSGSLVGALGNSSDADIKTVVQAHATNATLRSTGDVTILADAMNDAVTLAAGGAFGVGAFGAMIADATIGWEGTEEVVASLGAGTEVEASGALFIGASTRDALVADSVAASGGVVGVAGAQSTITSDNTAVARVADEVRIDVGSFVMSASQTHDVAADADSAVLALASGSGAGLDVTIRGKANVEIGAEVDVLARDNIAIDAANTAVSDTGLASGSAGLGNVSVLKSEAQLGTSANPLEASVDIGSGTTLLLAGDNQSPGSFEITTFTDTDMTDSVEIESISGFGVSVGISEVSSDTLSAIRVEGATLQSRAGDVFLTARSGADHSADANLLVATALTGGAGAVSTADATTENLISLDNATVKGAGVNLYAGQSSSAVPNFLATFANAEIFAASLLPNISVPDPTATISETNRIDLSGTTEIQALEDVSLFAVPGLGTDARTDGGVLSLSLIPYAVSVPDGGSVSSENLVDVGPDVRVDAGINNKSVVLVKPLRIKQDGVEVELPPADRIEDEDPLNDALNDADRAQILEDTGIQLSPDIAYHYQALSFEQVAISITTGTVVQVASDHNEGNPGKGTPGNFYRFRPVIQDSEPLVLQNEDYSNEMRWQDLGPTLTADDFPEITRDEQIDDSIVIYQSDETDRFADELGDKFYVVKPVDLDLPSVTYANIGNRLLEERDKILGWIVSHSTNAEAVARYEVQLAAVEDALRELGLLEDLDPSDPDAQLGSLVNQELDALFLEMPDVYAVPGSIFIEADATGADFEPLIGSQLVARAGAQIAITNESPFGMTVNDAVIRDNRRLVIDDGEVVTLIPGNVYLNNDKLTDVDDTAAKTISIVQQDPDFETGETFAVGDFLDVSLDMRDVFIEGDVVNEDGKVTIVNQVGSINVSGQIRAADIEISSDGDFNLNVQDWFHSNQDPRQYLNFDALRADARDEAGRFLVGRVLAWLGIGGFPSDPVLEFGDASDVPGLVSAIQNEESAVLAQGRIAVTARFLNINGRIQSGVDTVTLHIDETFQAPRRTSNLLDSRGNPLAGISFGDDGVPVNGSFDAERGAFVLDPIVPQGGEIILAGQILNTAADERFPNGSLPSRLRVAHGYTSVDIRNDTDFELVVDRIDTTTLRTGKITLIDTARLEKVEYVVDGEAVKVTAFDGTLIEGDPDTTGGEISTIDYVQRGEPAIHAFDDPAPGLDARLEYQPEEGLVYLWSEGQEKVKATVTKYEKRSFNLFGDNFLADLLAKDRSYQWRRTRFTDEQPILESEILARDGEGTKPSYADGQAYTILYEQRTDRDVEAKQNVTVVQDVSTGKVYRWIGENTELVLPEQNYADNEDWDEISPGLFDESNSNHFRSDFENQTFQSKSWTTGGGWLRTKTRHLRVTETEGLVDFYTHTLRADYPIGIEFLEAPSTPDISIRSTGGIFLQGDVESPEGGTMLLESSDGSILSADTVGVFGTAPIIRAGVGSSAGAGGAGAAAASSVGGAGMAGNPDAEVRLIVQGDTDGPVRVEAGGDIFITSVSETAGGSRVVIGTASSVHGDVVIHAPDGITLESSGSMIRGEKIELLARDGSVGTIFQPLRVDSDVVGMGGVAAKAQGDIHIVEVEGDLKLAQPDSWSDVEASIHSLGGDVTLETSDGSILDAFYEGFRPRSEAEAAAINEQLQLTGQEAVEAAQDEIRQEEAERTALYHRYFLDVRGATPSVLAHEIVVNGFDVGGNTLGFGEPHGLTHGQQVFLELGVDLSAENFADASRWVVAVSADFDLSGPVPASVALSPGQVVRDTDGIAYRFVAAGPDGVVLSAEDFGDGSRWAALEVDVRFDVNDLMAGEMVDVEVDDVVKAASGVVYRYVGTAGARDLAAEDFSEGSLWQEVFAPDFDLDELTAGDTVSITTGQLVRGLDGSLLRYLGAADAALELLAEDFTDASRWAEAVAVDLDVDALAAEEAVAVGHDAIVRAADDAEYRYVGADARIVDLRTEDFTNTGFWESVAADFDLDELTAGDTVSITTGQLVRGLDGSLLRYLGAADPALELLAEDFGDATRWEDAVDADADAVASRVDIAMGETARAADDVVYRFLAASETGVDLRGENFDDETRWQPVVSAAFDVDAVAPGTPVALDSGAIVRAPSGTAHVYLGADAGADLLGEEFSDTSRWVKAVEESYDLATLGPPGVGVALETGQTVRNTDGVAYEYVGADAVLPETNLQEQSAYYVIVVDDTTIQLAASRFDAVIAETPQPIDLDDMGSDGAVANVRLLQYDYASNAFDPDLRIPVENPNFDVAELTDDQVISQGQVVLLTADGLKTTYRYLGNANLDLVAESFSDTSRWLEAVPIDFDESEETQPVDVSNLQVVRAPDGIAYRFLGLSTETIDLSDEDYTEASSDEHGTEASRWEEAAAPDFDVADLSAGEMKLVAASQIVRAADGTDYIYLGVESLDLTAQDYGDTTFWQEVVSPLQAIHDSAGEQPYDRDFVFQVEADEAADRIAARTFDISRIRFPISGALSLFLFPDQNLDSAQKSLISVSTTTAEVSNVIGSSIQLFAGGTGEVGTVSGERVLDLSVGFENLTDAEREFLTLATTDAIVGRTYALYEYDAPDGSEPLEIVDFGEDAETYAPINLRTTDFGDTDLWSRFEPDFMTEVDTGEVEVANGETVLVQRGRDVYGLYRYVGPTDSLVLSEQDYGDVSKWESFGADFDTGSTSGVLLPGEGQLVADRFDLVSLTIQLFDDVELEASGTITIEAAQGVAVETGGPGPLDLRVERVRAGNDTRLVASGSILDLYTDPVAAVGSLGDVILASRSGSVEGVGAQAFRVQVGPAGALFGEANVGKFDVVQVGGNLDAGGVSQAISDLTVRRVVTLTGPIFIENLQGDVVIGELLSGETVDVRASGSILDATDDDRFTPIVNITTKANAPDGDVFLRAGGSVGSAEHLLDVRIENADLRIVADGGAYVRSPLDLDVAQITAASGDVEIQTIGHANIDRITALLGTVKIAADAGRVLDRRDDDQVNVEAFGAILNSTNIVANGVGSAANPFETRISRLEALVTNGGIWLDNDGDFEVGGISSLVGVQASSTIDLSAMSSLTISEAIDSAGDPVLLDASDDIHVNAAITSGGGLVRLLADRDMTFGATGSIDTESGASTVTLLADANGNGDGSITMADGAFVDATDGLVDVDATDDIVLGLLRSTTTVVVDSATGSILDTDDAAGIEPKDVIAPDAVLSAATGIGTSGNALETLLTKLEGDGGAGGLFVDDTGGLVIGTITSQPEGPATTGLRADQTVRVTTTGFMRVLEDVESTSADVELEAIDGATVTLVPVGDGTGDTFVSAEDGSDADEDLTLVSGVGVFAAANARLLAGDDLLLAADSQVAAGTSITLRGDHQRTASTNADAGVGARLDLDGHLDSVSILVTGQRDDDVVDLRPQSLAGHTSVLGDTDGLPGGEDLFVLDRLPSITTTHDRPQDGLPQEVRDTIDLDGRGGTDRVVVNISGGRTDYVVNVHDTGAPDDGADTLTIEATEADDLFLLRKHFVAYLSPVPSVDDTAPLELFPEVERINYDQTVNGRLRIDAGAGDDRFFVDDNSAVTTLDGGLGRDSFQIGQVFGSNPNGAVFLESATEPATPWTPGATFEGVTQTSSSGSGTGMTVDILVDTDGLPSVRLVEPGSGYEDGELVVFAPPDAIGDPITVTVGVDPRVVADDDDAVDVTSDSDEIEVLRITRGWLSNGITHAMTIFGGEDADTFVAYSNKAVLRMEGESGNDSFLIRAFVAEDDVIASGGDDDDFFEYNTNAPVSINGGAGFDTVTVIGSEKDDAFIITEDGVFGAGLNLQLDGVEEAIEVDGLEGDDQFFILGTRSNVASIVIGGLGNDTFNVSGDVTAEVVSQELTGRSGVINHGTVSDDADYSALLVDGIGLNIADESLGKVVISPDGPGTRVLEDGTNADSDDDANGRIDSYTIFLVRPEGDVDDTTVAYLTVSAVMSSSHDRRRPLRDLGSADPEPAGPHDGESVEISIDGGATWLKAAVLKFTAANWDTPQEVLVRAAHDDALEGNRKVMVSHSLLVESESERDRALFDEAAIANLEVDVTDDDLGQLLILETDGGTRVLEGLAGVGAIEDSYDVRLSVQPSDDVTVALSYDGPVDEDFDVDDLAPGQLVDLATGDFVRAFDGLAYRFVGEAETVELGVENFGDSERWQLIPERIEILDSGGQLVTQLTFTTSGWDTVQSLTVRAVNDEIPENRRNTLVLHTLSSNDPAYSRTFTADLLFQDQAGEADPRDTVVRTDGRTWSQEGYRDGNRLEILDGANAGAYRIAEVDGDTLRLIAEEEITPAAETVTLVRPAPTPVAELEVQVIDDESADVLVTESDGETVVVRGGEGDDYTLRLTTAPDSDVTVQLSSDGQTALGDADPADPRISFTDVGPAPSLTVTADIADNAAAPGSQNDTIARTDGGSWLDDGLRAGELIGVSGDANPVNSGVFRIDQVNDTVITLEADAALADSAGTTITVEQLFRVDFSDNAGAADPRDTITRTDGGSWLDDAFRIGTFLVVAGDAEPGNNGVIFKVNAVTDTVLTLTTSASLTDSTGSLITIQRKEPAVTFTTANWFEEVGIAVTADESFVLDPGQVFLRREPLRPHTIDDVTGPLILEGGVAEERDRSLNRAVMLPTEFTEAPLDLVIEGDESQRADRLNVFNDSSVSHDRGELRAIELRNDVVKLGDEDPTNDIRPMNLSGFGMSTGLTIDISEAQLGLDPDLIIDFPGGITFDDIEVTEILLGKGNDRLDIVDSNTGTPGAENFLITVVHGGGNTQVVSSGPMSFTGNATAGTTTITRVDGLDWLQLSFRTGRHVRVEGATENAGLYEIVDVRDDQLVVAGVVPVDEIGSEVTLSITGDTIVVSEGGGPESPLVIFGDTSQDGSRYDSLPEEPTGNAFFFGVHGDDVIDASASSLGVSIYGGRGNDVIFGSQAGDHLAGGSGDDEIHGLGGRDHIYGDSGLNVEFEVVVGEDGIPTVGRTLTVPAINESTAQTRDPLLAGRDWISSGDGADVTFGDHGEIVQSEGTQRILTTGEMVTIRSLQAVNGADDRILGGLGNDLIIGGRGSDALFGNEGNDLAFGDHGEVQQSLAEPVDLSLLPLATLAPNFTFTATHITTTETAPFFGTVEVGGDDYIEGNAGQDILLGQQGRDVIFGGLGDDDLIGGHNVASGQDAGDFLDGGAGNDVVAGDNAVVLRRGDALRQRVQKLQGDAIYGETQAVDDGQVLVTGTAELDPTGAQARSIALLDHSDTPTAGTWGDDAIAGGSEADELFGQLGSDVIQGDGAIGPVDLALATGDTQSLANDQILGFDGSSVKVVDAGRDTLTIREHGLRTGDLVTYSNGGAGDVGDLQDGASYLVLVEDVDTIRLYSEVTAGRDAQGLLQVSPSTEQATDGDDYIEGNGGADVLFGNLGQDDLVGGSSSFFGLAADESLRPDGSDLIFGGAGSDLARNGLGDEGADDAHARDADVIAGDNANVYRLIDAATGQFPVFHYDLSGDTFDAGYTDALRLIPRAVAHVDYHEGGPDLDAAALADNGGHDEIHGESGDDVVYGQVGDDVIFGEAQDDDLIGGWGHDWISGGTGRDGVIGDDGRIYTSRNLEGAAGAEVLFGLDGIAAGELDLEISTPGDFQQAIINVTGELKKSVNLTPFNVDPDLVGQDPLFDAQHADDLIYGGLGDDFLHGGVGDDAISGAEALPSSAATVYPDDGTTDSLRTDGVVISFGYDNPLVVSEMEAQLAQQDPSFAAGFRLLGFEALKGEEFSHYDEFDAREKILVAGQEYFLNFDPSEGPDSVQTPGVASDGRDRLFGDLGNDWLVGGTGRDNMYGGRGNDLMNADDDHSTGGGANEAPDGPEASYEDRAHGGAGRDVLIANTGGDRLIDWIGEFNSYIVPFAPFGPGTVSRQVPPTLFEFLYDLSASDGADPTRVGDAGNPERNGEPHGELGLVIQKDPEWQEQTGAPDDPQPGNLPSGERDVLRSANFNAGTSDGFAADTGAWTVKAGRLIVEPDSVTGDAVSVFYVDEWMPKYFEVEATINAVKPVAGYKANSYIIFDYHSPTDFKYAGVNVSHDKLEMGYRDETGWHELEQVNAQLKPDRDYRVMLALSGNTATLVVGGTQLFVHEYEGRVDSDGFLYGLNAGMIGFGSKDAKGGIDDIEVRVLAPEVTHEQTEAFDEGSGVYLPELGTWITRNGQYLSVPTADPVSLSTFSFDVAPPSVVLLETEVSTDDLGGIVFDYYDPEDFKYAAIDASSGEVVIGHRHEGAWYVDASQAAGIAAGETHQLKVELLGARVTVTLDGVEALNHAFFALVNDGEAGMLSRGNSSFDDSYWATDDPSFAEPENLLAATAPTGATLDAGTLSSDTLEAVADVVIDRWKRAGLDATGSALLDGVRFDVADLDDLALGREIAGDTIVVDLNAAGHGWFIDLTPDADEEFLATDEDGVLVAISESDAAGRIDLVTVIAHELGHVLGCVDEDPSDGSTTLMDGTLAPGVRLLPRAEDAAEANGKPAAAAMASLVQAGSGWVSLFQASCGDLFEEIALGVEDEDEEDGDALDLDDDWILIDEDDEEAKTAEEYEEGGLIDWD
jgi:Ca2+-binding RTX toxin-like protein